MNEIIDIQSSDWEKQVAQEKRPTVVEYWHNKCSICKEMKSTYDIQPSKFDNTAKFTRMNLLENKENRKFAIRQGVRSTPTFVVYCEGRPIGQIVGYRDFDDFTSELEELIGNADNCLMSTPIEE